MNLLLPDLPLEPDRDLLLERDRLLDLDFLLSVVTGDLDLINNFIVATYLYPRSMGAISKMREKKTTSFSSVFAPGPCLQKLVAAAAVEAVTVAG